MRERGEREAEEEGKLRMGRSLEDWKTGGREDWRSEELRLSWSILR